LLSRFRLFLIDFFESNLQKFQSKSRIESRSFEANLYSSNRVSKCAQIAKSQSRLRYAHHWWAATERGRPVVCSHWVGGLAVPVSRRRRRRRGTAVGQAMQSRRRRAHGATRRHAAPPRSVFRRRLHVTAVGAGVYMTRNMVQIVDTTSLALPNYTVPKIIYYS